MIELNLLIVERYDVGAAAAVAGLIAEVAECYRRARVSPVGEDRFDAQDTY